MLPLESASLLGDFIRELMRKHTTERDEKIKAFRFRMHNQGLGQSSAFNQGMTELYEKALDGFAGRLPEELGRFLVEIGFETYDGCEQDLAALIKQSLFSTYAADSASMIRDRALQHSLDLLYVSHDQNAAIKAKLITRKVRAFKEREKPQMSTQINNYLSGPNSRITMGTDQSSNVLISESDLFQKLREAVERQVSDPATRIRLLETLNEGKALPKKTPLYDRWYVKFIGLTADCFTVIQPFIQPLVSLLSQPPS